MNIEDYREYCLSLGADVEEKLPFQKFFAKQSGKAERKSGEGVLVFYVMGTCSHSSTAMTFQSSH